MRLSARNQIKGKIIEVRKGATTAHVKVEIASGRQVITSSITNEAVEEIDLKVGNDVIVVIKASDVKGDQRDGGGGLIFRNVRFWGQRMSEQGATQRATQQRTLARNSISFTVIYGGDVRVLSTAPRNNYDDFDFAAGFPSTSSPRNRTARSRVKRTSTGGNPMSAFDPKRKSAVPFSL
jgi:molybdopterin-binding protein